MPLIFLALLALAAPPEPPAGFRAGPWFDEPVRDEWVEGDVRIAYNLPAKLDPAKPTRLVIFATPNGNTIEQTLGCAKVPGLDWHFDIQHVAAQVRRWREVSPGENVVLACLEAEGLSWPAWRKRHTDAAARARRVVDGIRSRLPGDPKVTLTGHSGGGSFLWSFLDGGDALPDWVERISFLDSNYSYADEKHHGDKLLAWLRSGPARVLSVIAYDDRKITLNGKLVVGPDGGTFRATDRMLARFRKDLAFTDSSAGEFDVHSALDGRLVCRVHRNPQNKILHTVLVGEMNGVLQALTEGTPHAPTWGTFGGPRAYADWVQPAPGIPPRPAQAPGGAAFMKSIARMPIAQREEAIAREFLRGNVPEFLRKSATITVRGKDKAGKEHTVVCEVMPDYLAVGSDSDFVRVPMTPQTAQRIADAFGYQLMTTKLVDEVYRQAAVKLEPRPLTKDREAVDTFVEHNHIIECQRAGKALGLLVAGIKKDVVVTNRLAEKPNKVAIYGWHKLDGKPIQPLTTVHTAKYVDYSHGVRLARRTVKIDGKERDLRFLLHDPNLCVLLSNEGPLNCPTY